MVAEDLGVATIENAFGVLRQVLGVAVEDNRIPRNPCDGVKIPKRQHADRGYLTHHQVAALAGAVERMPEVIRFLAYTGLRWGEMAALRVCDFNMLRRRINVSRSVTEFNGLVWSTPKTGERRSVPFPASLAGELAALMVGKAPEDLVFAGSQGTVFGSLTIDAGFSRRPSRSAARRTAHSRSSHPTICVTLPPVWRSAPKRT